MKKPDGENEETEEMQFPENVTGRADPRRVPAENSNLVATIAAGLLGPGFHEVIGAPPDATKRTRSIQLAVRRAREIVTEAAKPDDLEVRAYQLFEPGAVMSDTDVAKIFKKAGWGKARMTSADTVKQCVRDILAEARKEARYAEQRRGFLRNGLDPEYGRMVMKRTIARAFKDANFDAIFGESADGEIERILDHLYRRSSETLHGNSMEITGSPLVDAGFSMRVFLSPRSDLDIQGSCDMGTRKMASVATALRHEGIGAEAGEKSVKQLDALIFWFSAFSDFPPKAIEALEECRSIAESGVDAAALVQRCGSLFDMLDEVSGERLATDFLGTLDWDIIYDTCELDAETTEVEEWPSMVREPGDDENQHSAALRFIQGLKELIRWRDLGEAPSFSGTTPAIPNEKYHSRTEMAKAYERSLALTLGFLDEMEFYARRAVDHEIADNLGDEFAKLYELLRREIISLEFFGDQIDQGDLKDWGETQIREVLWPSSSKFMPYSIFLYADLRGLQRNRLVPRDLTKVDRSMIGSDLHEEGEPIPYGVGVGFPDVDS